ncbi:MAG: hypothetical protein IKS00_07970 [Bacteroidales bacterium]|nr:hypothetical protein [Bacteroidales bacterium]
MALVFLSISPVLATEANVTVNVTGNGTVSYGNQSASDGQSFTFSAELSVLNLDPYEYHPNTVTLSLTHESNYIAEINRSGYLSQKDGSEYSFYMPFEAGEITINVAFVELFQGGTQSSPVILSDNSITHLAGGWYKVTDDITFNQCICIWSDTYLAVDGGATMSIIPGSGSGFPGGVIYTEKDKAKLTINGAGTLRITANDNQNPFIAITVGYEQLSGNVELSGMYGMQSGNNNNIDIHGGHLTIKSWCGISCKSKISISGGIVDINATGNLGGFYGDNLFITGGVVNVHMTETNDNQGIEMYDIISITGGQVTVDGGDIEGGDIILGCTKPSDFIQAPSYTMINNGRDYSTSIADGQILTDGENLYSGTLSNEQIAAIANKKLYLLFAGGVLTLTQDQNGTSAKLQGDFLSSDASQLVISSKMKVDHVTLERTFTQNTPASVMFPFSFDASNVDGNFYTLDEVVFENGVWTAKMAGPITQIAANTPYIFKLKDGIDQIDNLTFNNVDLQPTTTINTNGSESDWTLHGVYSKTYFDDIQGVCYGFAGAAVPEDGISVGQFIRAGEGSWVNPMRCYLTYNKNNGVFAKSAPDLPDYIRVVFPDEVEESESGEIVTPVSSLSETTGVKVWSSNRTIFIDAQPDTDYTIVDLSGRVLKTGITHSTREEITLSASGIVIVKIGKQTFKIIL